MTISQEFPEIKSALICDFINSRTVDPRLTTERASTATVFNANGVMQEVAANVPRIDHDPYTGACKGLLIEGQRTNLIRNPRFEGATVGVVGSGGVLPTNWVWQGNLFTIEVIAVGTQFGMPFIELKLTATGASNAFLTIEDSTTVTGSTSYFYSLRARRTGANTNMSSITGQHKVNLATVTNGATLPNMLTMSTTYPDYYSGAWTTPSDATVAAPQLTILSSGAGAEFQFRLYAPQYEAGTWGSSLILPPVGFPATSTRAVESLNSTSIDSWFNNVNGSWVVNGSTTVSGLQPLVSLDDNTANEQIRLYTNGADPRFTITDGGSTQADLDAGTVVANTRFSLACTYLANDFAASLNGGTPVTDTSGTVPSVNRVRMGRNQAGNQMWGYLERASFYTERLTNAQLQALSRLT